MYVRRWYYLLRARPTFVSTFDTSSVWPYIPLWVGHLHRFTLKSLPEPTSQQEHFPLIPTLLQSSTTRTPSSAQLSRILVQVSGLRLVVLDPPLRDVMCTSGRRMGLTSYACWVTECWRVWRIGPCR
ncbi:hypothetical protein K439DRAFT_442033 [Ramaria rubella]|nr:hypothetical protein K439DRAFT_442033 [Ramaria rubella]